MRSRLNRSHPFAPCGALAVALCFALAPRTARSDDTATIRGRVIDEASRAPIAHVIVQAGGASVRTTAAGEFLLRLVPGTWTLALSANGYLAADRVVVLPGAGAEVEVALTPKPRFSEAVDVNEDDSSPSKADAIPLRPRAVLATAGAVDNVFRVIQTLPGVAATEEFGSRLSVRGGGPDQNLTIMDGVEIHNPYRLLGLTSAFNPETVERFELTAGGFSAKYGDRLSSLLVIDNRSGTDADAFRGSSALSVTDGNLIFEGKLPGAAKGSWLATARRTYYDLVAERFVKQDLPSFADLQVKTTWEPRAGQRLSLFALRSREGTNANFNGNVPGERGDFLAKARNDLFSARFQTKLGGRGASTSTLAWYRNVDRLDVDARFKGTGRRSNAPGDDAVPFINVAFARDLAVRDLSFREDVSVQASPKHLFEGGFETHALATSLGLVITGDRNLTEANGSSVRGGAGLPDALQSAPSATRLGAWIQDRYTATDRLSIEPGVRVDRSSVNGATTFSPRLAATMRLDESTRLRLAGGTYRQSPGYEKLIQADYFVDLTPGARSPLRSERSRQVVLGIERDLGDGLLARVEAYGKRFDDLIIGRLETDVERAARVARYDFPASLSAEIPTERIITTNATNDGKGSARGFDLYVARTRSSSQSGLSGWAAYTFEVARREAYGREYAFEYDRRHSLSLVGAYRFGPHWDVAATFRAASGFPRTPVERVRVSAVEDARGRLVPERDAALRLVYSVDLGGVDNLNTERLPTFARLDLRGTFRPKGASGRWEFYLDVINALNRKNAGALDPELAFDPSAERPRVVEKRTASIPFLPSFGIRFRF